MIGLNESASGRSPAEGAVGYAVPPAREGVFHILAPVDLHFGGRLSDIRVAWSLTGPPSGPVVVALGGISAGRRVSGQSGWWGEIVGPGKALDTDRCQVLGIDYLGGSGETTGPGRGERTFPAISAYDQSEVLRHLITHLDIAPVQAIIGASYGGMVALAFAERWPKLVRHVLSISAADRSHPMATAWRSVQRAIVRYALDKDDGPEGLRLARALAMATYRSPEEFAKRFAGDPQRGENGYRFPVESYLLARGDAYAQAYIPEAFVCLSESIDLHRIDAGRITVPTTLVAIREDQLVPLADMRALRARLAGPAELVELSSIYGHDAFLKESVALRPVFALACGLAESAYD